MKEVFDPSVTYCINFCAQHQISKKAVIFLFAKPGCTDSFHFCNSFVIVLAPFAKSMLKVSYADRVYHVLVFHVCDRYLIYILFSCCLQNVPTGAKYELPKYVLSEPTNLIRET
jgi:hypothetical protein